ncbi:hypothetical protein IV60_GL000801 [Lancefieldella rimae]|uniref:Uncharacterized protein n=1 Tax=Lancefieldella rimae TaxID=1383 RepID=A0ABR5Q2F1_9ACTN|nr:hypothetical protein IV60_GL000801 [Lancefieldella rimae]
MPRIHWSEVMRAFARSAPQVNSHIGLALALDPNPHVAEPPQVECSRCDLCALDLLVQPGAPSRKDLVDPGLSCDLLDIRHLQLLE